jgi:hypothetical protein
VRAPPRDPAVRITPAAKVRLALHIWTWRIRAGRLLRTRPLPEAVAALRPGHPAHAPMAPRVLAAAVDHALGRGRPRPRCIVRAAVLFRLLAEQGDAPELVIGLPEGASDARAHAWVELDGVDVGPPPGRMGHAPMARFA